MVLWLEMTRIPAAEAKGGAERKRRPFQRDIRDVIAIEVAFDAGMSPAERRQWIWGGISIEIIKVDHDGTSTQDGVKGDSLLAIGVVGDNERLTERDEAIGAGQVTDRPAATGTVSVKWWVGGIGEGGDDDGLGYGR